MSERAERAIEECRLIATMSEEPGRTTRRFLTAPFHQVHHHLRTRMQSLGMDVLVDAVGNLRGLWTSSSGLSSKRLILGSHIDTVPDGGPFDGVLGVVLALELVESAKRLKLPIDIEVIAFSEEEGVRFSFPFIGSRAVAGRFDPSMFALKDANGTTIKQAIENFGIDLGRLEEAAADADAVGFVEIHIEQGPVLEAEGLSVAAVTSIVGQTRLDLRVTGHANHAGTTPMRLRRDAVAASAEWISKVEMLAVETDGLVATVGKMEVHPNAGNVVAGSVDLSLDVRHVHDGTRRTAVDDLLKHADAIATRRGLKLEWNKKMDEPSVPMDERLTAFMTDAIEAAGFPAKSMPSGAGHDAMIMARRMPTAMLFLRTPGGVSHHPGESVREEDVEAAVRVGEKFLQRLSAAVG
ncbi:allantoate amidohydrolase [Telmatobacter sp. DSM 110680]|uniref:Allantoate amidohydrolase n=1 Tax=Telmatobacter sp. DSM 110680 TaxID=3036704 RepID=A0AAU7DPT8_9BACT